MAIALVQAVYWNASFPLSIPIASTGAGNFIACLFSFESTGATITGVTDNVGNTYIQVPGAYLATTLGNGDIWYSKNSIAGATTIGVTCPTGTNSFTTIAEFSGVALTNPVDHVAQLDHSTNPGTGQETPILTTTNAGDLLLSVSRTSATHDTSISSPWAFLPSGSPIPDYFVYSIAPGAPGTYQGIYAPGVPQTFYSVAASFLPPSSGPNAAVRTGMFLVFP